MHEKRKTLLHLAATSRSAEMVELLLRRGTAISAEKDDGSTALHIAAENGHQKMIPLLLRMGADASCVDKTPLHCAVQVGYGEATRLLEYW